MIWCDKVGSTPLIGMVLSWRYASGAELLDHFTPILKNLVTEDETAAFGVDTQDSFNLVFTTDEGFQYTINANNLTVGFAHRIRFKTVAGGRPQVETLTKSANYTELLDSAIKHVANAVRFLPDAGDRTFKRIGIVTNSIVEQESEFPPGLLRLVSYFAGAWKNPVDYYHYQATTNLRETARYAERCIHKISKNEGKEALPSLNFDWQRVLIQPKPLREETVRDELKSAKEAAFKYFEALAEGNEFNERVASCEDASERAD